MWEIDELVVKLDSTLKHDFGVSTGGRGFDQPAKETDDAQEDKSRKKAANMTNWLHSENSLIDSQPHTTKVLQTSTLDTGGGELMANYMKHKRKSISEKNIEELKSQTGIHQKKQPQKESSKQIPGSSKEKKANQKSEIPSESQPALHLPNPSMQPSPSQILHISTLLTGGSNAGAGQCNTNSKPTNCKKLVRLSKKKEKKRDPDLAADRTEHQPATHRSKRRAKSRENSLKFLTERTYNMFGEKMSFVAPARGSKAGAWGGLHCLQQFANKPLKDLHKRDKSGSLERKQGQNP